MFTQACKYGIRSVLYLAINSNEDKKYGIAKISQDLEIPHHFLAKILQQLVKNKLISSQKGPNGGFYMTETNKELKLWSVILSIDGDGLLHNCVLGLESCNPQKPCAFHHSYTKVKDELFVHITQKKIKEVAEDLSKGKNLYFL